jgi:hypothetical protein
MTENIAAADPKSGIRQYQLLSLVALGVIFVADLQDGVLLLSLLVLMVGLFGVLSRLRLGPILVVLVVAAGQLGRQLAWGRLRLAQVFPVQRIGLNELVLAMGVLAYVMAHYRMQGLMLNIVPRDPRLRVGPSRWFRRPKLLSHRRSGGLVTPHEVGWFLLCLPLWVLVGQLLWTVLAPPRIVFGLAPGPIRVILGAWSLGLGIFVTIALLNLWRRRQNSPELAALSLQDVLWKETRREQRRLNRWLAWWRLKQSRSPKR